MNPAKGNDPGVNRAVTTNDTLPVITKGGSCREV